jgi:general secretion pathway protein D
MQNLPTRHYLPRFTLECNCCNKVLESSMRKILPLLLIVSVFAGALKAQQEEPEPFLLRGMYEDIQLLDIIQITADYQDIKFLFQPAQVRQTVTIVAPNEGFTIPPTAWFSVLQAFLKQYRLILTPFGEDTEQSVRFYEIIPAVEAMRQSERVIFLDDMSDWTDTSADFVTLVVNLKYADANNVMGALRNLATQQGGLVQPIQGINSLIVADYSYNIRRLAQIIQLMDQPPRSPRLEVINVDHIDAEELVTSLTNLLNARQQLQQQQGQQRDETMVVVEVAPYVNAVMVTGFDAGIELVRELVSKLDQEIPGAVTTGRIHYYAAKNVQAEQLAGVLNEVLGVGLPTQQQQLPGQQQFQDPNAPVIVADEATNSLLIIATPADYNEIKKVIDQLDVRRPQVMIEAAILEVRDDSDFLFGVEVATVDGFGGNEPRVNFGSNFGFSEIVDSAGIPIGTGGGVPAGRAPIIGTGGLLTLNKGGAFDIPLLVRFLKTQADTNVLQQPMIITNENEEALIEVQTEIQLVQFQDVSGVGSRTGAGEFVEAGIQMSVTPQISEDGYITLVIDLDITNFTGESATPGVSPPRQRRHIRTHVTIPDESTVVVGGLKSSESSKTINKIPLLGDIPLLGELFKSQRKVDRRTNLYIFLRPKILKDANFDDYRELSRDMLKRAELDSLRQQSPQQARFFDEARAEQQQARRPAPGEPDRAFDYQGLDRRR